MKIAVALGGTDWGKSGVGVYTSEVLPRLRARLESDGGSMVAIGTPKDLEAYADRLVGVERYVAPVDKPATSALWYMLRSNRVASKVQADVLLLPAANRRVSIMPTLPTVGVVHDLAQLHVDAKYDAMRMFYFHNVMLRSLTRMQRLVAVSEATKRDLVNTLPASAPPMDVVLNGVDAARFTPLAEGSPQTSPARDATGLSEPYLLYTSRLEHPGKNHLRLIRAYAESPVRNSHALALAGKDWGAQALLEREAKALGVYERVRFLGFVSDAVLPGLVAGADAVIMVGLHEGFGLPALEAISMGKPVCASNTGALPEVVGPYASLCDPFDEASIRGALEGCLHPDLVNLARSKGHQWAEKHSWDRTAEGLISSCRAALGT